MAHFHTHTHTHTHTHKYVQPQVCKTIHELSNVIHTDALSLKPTHTECNAATHELWNEDYLEFAFDEFITDNCRLPLRVGNLRQTHQKVVTYKQVKAKTRSRAFTVYLESGDCVYILS